MSRAIQTFGIYLISVTTTALSVTLLYDTASVVDDLVRKIPLEINAALFAQVATLLIFSWLFTLLFALIPLFVIFLSKHRWVQSLKFHLFLGAVMGTSAAFFLYSHAPEGPPSQTLAKMISDPQFWNLTACIVISAVLGSFVFWRGTRMIETRYGS